MYQVALTQSYFPVQADGVVLETTIGGVLQAAGAATPEAVFLCEAASDGSIPRTWTYAALLAEAEALALALRSRIALGERIVIWAPNMPEWVVMQFAASLAGLVLVTANPALRAGELRYVVEQSRAVAIFACTDYRGSRLEEIARSLQAEIPALRAVFNIEHFDHVGVVEGSAVRPPPLVRADDPAQIQYTSGTTGLPKGAVISHRALTNNARLAFDRLGVRPGMTLLHLMPLFHTGGCGFLLLGGLQHGMKIVMPAGFDAALANQLIESQSVSLVLGVPTMLNGMLDRLRATPRDFSSLELVFMGGSTVPAELVRRVSEEFGSDAAVLFGQTEASSNISATWRDDAPEDIANTVGQPLACTEVAIRDPQSGAVMPVGEVGEICLRGYTILIEYNDNPDATARAIDPEGWLHTGDLGTLDRRGYLSVTGRLKDMIVRGGENIYPAEIEQVLARHPSVAEAAVIGIPDAHWGEVVACYVRLIPGATFEPEQLLAHCRANLASAKAPLHWRAIDAWPLTGSGKIKKYALREMFEREAEGVG